MQQAEPVQAVRAFGKGTGGKPKRDMPPRSAVVFFHAHSSASNVCAPEDRNREHQNRRVSPVPTLQCSCFWSRYGREQAIDLQHRGCTRDSRTPYCRGEKSEDAEQATAGKHS